MQYIINLKKFIKYFGDGRRFKLCLFLIMSLIAGCIEFLGVALIYPFIMMIISPEASQNIASFFKFFPINYNISSLNFALILGGAALALFVCKNLYMIIFLYVQNKFLQKWTQHINNMFIHFFLCAPYKNIMKISKSDKIYILTTLSPQSTNGFLMRIMALITNLSIVALILALILWKFPLAGFVSLSFIAVCLTIQSIFFKKRVRELGISVQKVSKEMNEINYSTTNNIKDIKIFNCEKTFYNNYGKCGAKLSSQNTLISFYTGIPPYMVETLIVFTLLILGGLIAFQSNGENSVLIASFAMIVASVFRIAPALNRIQSALLNLPTGLNFVKGLNSVYENLGLNQYSFKFPEGTDKMPFRDKIILHEISFSYDNDKEVLHNISFEINRDDFVGIIGLSGAGKSTLADIFTGLLEPDSGEIIVDNIKLTKENISAFRKNIGYVQQELTVLGKSFRENIAWGIPEEEIDDNRVKYLINLVRLDGVVYQYKDGIYAVPFIGENGLSRGQKQRLAIARALYRDPQILLFDEATSALDVKVEHEITSMLTEACKNKTIIAIAHRLSTLKACNKLIYLKDGYLVDIGTFENLSDKYPEFAELVRLSSMK